MINFAPVPRESDQTRSFCTHASYVRGFRELALGEQWKGLEAATAGLHAAAADGFYAPPGVPQELNQDQVISCLRRAWTTASLLEVTHTLAQEPEIIRLANGWGAVQAYYVLYSAAQALLVADGHERPTQHEQTKRQFVDLWSTRASKLPPWSLASSHSTMKEADDDGFLAGPGRRLDLSIHPWSGWHGEQAWDVAAKALRTTRDNLLDERMKKARDRKLSDRRKAWRRECEVRAQRGQAPRDEPKTARLTAEERGAEESRLRPVTFADYLYRLRVKANYDDITVFAEGPATDAEAAALASDLVDLASATLLVHEVRIAGRIGSRRLVRAMDDVLQRSSAHTSGHLPMRRDLHSRL